MKLEETHPWGLDSDLLSLSKQPQLPKKLSMHLKAKTRKLKRDSDSRPHILRDARRWYKPVIYISSDSHPWGGGSEVSASVRPPCTQGAGSLFWPRGSLSAHPSVILSFPSESRHPQSVPFPLLPLLTRSLLPALGLDSGMVWWSVLCLS